MKNRVVITYLPGYFSSFINLDSISIDIANNMLSYSEEYFDDIDEIEGHLTHFNEPIDSNSFNRLIDILDNLRDVENEYEYYDSECTTIEVYSGSLIDYKLDFYCNLNKNPRLSDFIDYIRCLIGSEYLLPSMIKADDINEE